MDKSNRLCCRRSPKRTKFTLHDSEEYAEVSSIEWEFVSMTEQEEDLIFRMYKLVGDRWDLIAGRVVGREAKEIERFWIMRKSNYFSHKRLHQLHSVNKFPRFSISPP